MLATLLSAAITCAAALVLGQGVLRLCGRRTWTWLAAPVGLSALMLLAVPALHVPGRSTTMGVIIALATLAGVVAMVREPLLRPPIAGALAALPALGLTLVPFAVAGRVGTLGVGFDNDMASHLTLAEAHVSEAANRVSGVTASYPLGPHAVTAAIAAPLGMSVDLAFVGVTIAGPILLGWTALAALRRAGWLGQAAVVTFAGVPYLIAGFYGEGSFKEVHMAVLALGAALALSAHPIVEGRSRWVPFGVLVTGTVCVFSYSGLLWPIGFLAAWAVVMIGREVAHGPAGALSRSARALGRELPSMAIGLAVLLVVLIPQYPRVYHYLSDTGGGSGLDKTSLGNLAGRLPLWEAFGVWHSPDFRLAPADPITAGALAALVLVLVIAGIGWSLRRSDWGLPLAVVMCALIWAYADRTQSPYLAAKGLAILSPFAMLVAVRPLCERDGWRTWPAPWAAAAPVILLVLAWQALGSSWWLLRHSPVGPRDHLVQLRDLRSSLHGRPTLFLGNDDFVRWELSGVPVSAPLVALPNLGWRAEKAWQYGQALDIDDIQPVDMNKNDWLITPRDAVGSQLPAQYHFVRATRDFALYRRVGLVAPRDILAEGAAPAAPLDCRGDRKARALVRRGGIAAVRDAPAGVLGPVLNAGADRLVTMKLGAGSWDLVMQYLSGLPFDVSGPGLGTVHMTPNLDRPGPRYAVGRVHLERPGVLSLRVRVPGHPLSSTAFSTYISAVNANPIGTERTVPLRQACGKLVDWYRPAR